MKIGTKVTRYGVTGLFLGYHRRRDGRRFLRLRDLATGRIRIVGKRKRKSRRKLRQEWRRHLFVRRVRAQMAQHGIGREEATEIVRRIDRRMANKRAAARKLQRLYGYTWGYAMRQATTRRASNG